MRLFAALCVWPKNLPPGNIRIGKRQMVRKVKKHHMRQMEQDVEREKKNMFYCMNPAVTVEKERALYQQLEKEEDTREVYFKMMKAYKESTTMAPRPLSNHYDILNQSGTWQKY